MKYKIILSLLVFVLTSFLVLAIINTRENRRQEKAKVQHKIQAHKKECYSAFRVDYPEYGGEEWSLRWGEMFSPEEGHVNARYCEVMACKVTKGANNSLSYERDVENCGLGVYKEFYLK